MHEIGDIVMYTLRRCAYVMMLMVAGALVCPIPGECSKIAVGQGNTVYSTASDGSVMRYTGSGKQVAVLKPSKAWVPSFVTSDKAGRLYVRGMDMDSIVVLSPSGRRVTTFHLNDFSVDVVGVAITSAGDVLAISSGQGGVIRISASGRKVGRRQLASGRGGSFTSPVSIVAGPGDTLYLCDSGRNCIQRFDRTGRLLAQWGSEGSRRGQFSMMSDMAVDRAGNVYVADTGNHRIQKFDSSGHCLAIWGSVGSGPGEFAGPRSIAVDSNGSVYVRDYPNRERIQKLDNRGRFVTQWPVPD